MAKKSLLDEKVSADEKIERILGKAKTRQDKMNRRIAEDDAGCEKRAEVLVAWLKTEASSHGEFSDKKLEKYYMASASGNAVSFKLTHSTHYDCIGEQEAKQILKRALPDCEAVNRLQFAPIDPEMQRGDSVTKQSMNPSGRCPQLGGGYVIGRLGKGGFAIISDEASDEVFKAAAVKLHSHEINNAFGSKSIDELKKYLGQTNFWRKEYGLSLNEEQIAGFNREVTDQTLAFRTGHSRGK